MEIQVGGSEMNLKNLNNKLKLRLAGEDDMLLYYKWANDPEVRNVSFYPEVIDLKTHEKWFTSHIQSDKYLLFVFEEGGIPVGQVRIERAYKNVISISIDREYRGKGYGALMLQMAYEEFRKVSGELLTAYIRKDNPVSVRIFQKAGYKHRQDSKINGITCYTLIKE